MRGSKRQQKKKAYGTRRERRRDELRHRRYVDAWIRAVAAGGYCGAVLSVDYGVIGWSVSQTYTVRDDGVYMETPGGPKKVRIHDGEAQDVIPAEREL